MPSSIHEPPQRFAWQTGDNFDCCWCRHCILISGFQARDVFFAPNITEETKVIIKDEQGTCTVQAEDDIPRTIDNCPYNEGDMISITYKRERPPISEHHLVREQ